MQEYDFTIPVKYRGQQITVSGARLNIPRNALYLTVNPLEDEEEFLGIQGDSNRQEIIYYDASMKCVDVLDLEGSIITSDLMHELEQLLQPAYS